MENVEMENVTMENVEMENVFIPPNHTKTLLIHGSATDATFLLPQNVEVITFTKVGKVLEAETAFSVLNLLQSKFNSLNNKDLSYLHEHFYKVNQSSFPFKKADYEDVRVRVFRAGTFCNNIPLEFVKHHQTTPYESIYNTETSQIDTVAPFTPVGKEREVEFKTFYENFPEVPHPSPGSTQHQFTLGNFVQFISGLYPGTIRLFVLCCASGLDKGVNMNVETNTNLKNAFGGRRKTKKKNRKRSRRSKRLHNKF